MIKVKFVDFPDSTTRDITLEILKEEFGEVQECDNPDFLFYSLKEGTLYPILHAFEKDGYVESYWEGKEGERRRKYYHLTKKGIKVLQENKQEWESYSKAVGKVIGGVANATA